MKSKMVEADLITAFALLWWHLDISAKQMPPMLPIYFIVCHLTSARSLFCIDGCPQAAKSKLTEQSAIFDRMLFMFEFIWKSG